MPVLTDRQEPEDFDKSSDEDPNAYALSYLFSQKRPAVELQRTGQVLVLAGAGANIMAFLVLLASVIGDFRPTWLLLVVSPFVPLLSAFATYRLWKQHRGYVLLIGLAALLMIGGILLGQTLLPDFSDLSYLLYYLPGTLVMLIGVALLTFKPNPPAV